MVNWLFGLVVWISGIPLWKGLLFGGITRIPNHQRTIIIYLKYQKRSTTVEHLRHLNQNISASHNSYQTSGWMALDGFDMATPAVPGLDAISIMISNPKTLHTSLTFSSNHRQRHPTLLHSITKYHSSLSSKSKVKTFPDSSPNIKTSTRFEDAKWQCPQSRNNPLVADVVTCRQKGQRVAPGWRFWCWCSHSRQSTWPQGTNATTGPCSCHKVEQRGKVWLGHLPKLETLHESLWDAFG